MRPLVVLAARCLELAAGRYLSAVVAATPSIAAAYGHRAVVVQNFPTASEFRSDGIEYQSRANAVAYIGGISALRGAKPMVEAISLVDSTLDPELELAGSFQPPALRDECEREAGWQRTRFHEWIGRKEVAEVLRRARVGLVVFQPAPNHLESYPTKLFEYLSAGIPVVASDFPLWRRLIVDGGYGLVVDPQSPSAIAEAISHLLKHPDEAERMGARGRKGVMTQFNWGVEEQKLLKLYRELLR